MKTKYLAPLLTFFSLGIGSFALATPPPIPDIPPPPNAPYISSVSSAPLGIVLDFAGSHLNTYDVQRRYGSGTWSDVSHELKKYKTFGINRRISVSIPLSANTSNIQYRVRACSFYGCSGYSQPTQSLTFNSYDVDKGDDNGNGIRNDVERHIEWLAAPSTREYDYLFHYAYYLSNFVNNSYSGGSRDGMLDIVNMSKAYGCISNEELLIDVQSVILDSEAAFTRYNQGSEDYSNSTYSGYDGDDNNCSEIGSYDSTQGTVLSAIDETTVDEKFEFGISISKDAQLSPDSSESQLAAAQIQQIQSSTPYVIYVNGMWTDNQKAIRNTQHIQKLFNEYGRPDVKVELSLNYSAGKMADLYQAFKQYTSQTNKEKGFYELVKDLRRFNSGLDTKRISQDDLTAYFAQQDYTSYREGEDIDRLRALVNTIKSLGANAVILAHSQGNFFANEVWEETRA